MALHRYFKPADDVLPSPTGDLSTSVSPATIKGRGPKLALALNVRIKTAKISSGGETGFWRKFGPVKISHYTVPQEAERWLDISVNLERTELACKLMLYTSGSIIFCMATLC